MLVRRAQTATFLGESNPSTACKIFFFSLNHVHQNRSNALHYRFEFLLTLQLFVVNCPLQALNYLTVDVYKTSDGIISHLSKVPGKNYVIPVLACLIVECRPVLDSSKEKIR